MKVLVLNSGSSSVKYQLFEFAGASDNNGNGAEVLAKGIAERVGLKGSRIKCSCKRDLSKGDCGYHGADGLDLPNHAAAIRAICDHLLEGPNPMIEDRAELVGIGHRVVHGGERFTGSVLIDDDVIDGIEDCAQLAPLHNPPALEGIRACADVFDGIPQVAVFDTAFHHTIPKHAYIYPIPKKFYTENRLRKYGFHGTSHMYVAEQAARILKRDIGELRTITCHLGNGCSITAVDGGKSVDTSMGLTPLGGVMMGTRPGDLDPYMPIFMSRELDMTIDEVDKTLNKESGLKGICGRADMRDVWQHANGGDEDCKLALDMFAYRIARYIGSYAMVLGGVDCIVFTAGIGENDPELRAKILERAAYLGVKLDADKNARSERIISTDDASTAVLVVPTNEELVIARETAKLTS